MMQLEIKYNEERPAETKADSEPLLIVPTSSQPCSKPNVGRGALYALSTDWGDFLQDVSTSGGTIIFRYTRLFSQALILEKSKANYYCQIKSFFTPIKLAG